jgi:capsular polysaccharide biosynthesis protein
VFGSSSNGKTAMLEFCEDAAESNDNGILLSGRNDYNWYHWMVEYLPRVIEIEKEIDPEIPWVISNRVPKTGIEALKMISTRDILVCDSEKLQHFKKLIVMSPNASVIDTVLAPWERISRFNTHNLHGLRSAMRSASSKSSFPEKVFIVRESTHRNVLNQDQLVDIARGYGFRPISIENQDFSEQLDLFSNAKVIITAGGAVMANYLFMSEGSHVIQLNNEANKDFVIPPLLSSIAGSKFISILGKPKKVEKVRHLRIDQIHESYVIKPRILKSVLESLNKSSIS